MSKTRINEDYNISPLDHNVWFSKIAFGGFPIFVDKPSTSLSKNYFGVTMKRIFIICSTALLIMHARELKFINAFNAIRGVGPATLRLLGSHFASFETAWHASTDMLAEAGLHPKARDAILQKKSFVDPDREMEKLIQSHIWVIAEKDAEYPRMLKEIPNPPAILYGQGGDITSFSSLFTDHHALGVVGTRRPTPYGIESTKTFIPELIQAGFTIISGLATGIDTMAHRAALEAGGRTVAVIGSGLEEKNLFPSENIPLARRIKESGNMIISEYAPDTPPLKEHFPQRNRIISGLSRGVFVVEAREKSGALITARFALEQNREVFALPGSIFSPTAKGTNALIQQGAKLVSSPRDILEEFGIDPVVAWRAHNPISEKEQNLFHLLAEPVDIDTLKMKTGLDTPTLITLLSMLELKGVIRNLGADTYQAITS